MIINFHRAFETIRFPAGEPHVRCIMPADRSWSATVVCHAFDWNDLAGIRAASEPGLRRRAAPRCWQ